MQTSFKAFWTRFQFPARFKPRKILIAAEEQQSSDADVRRGFTMHFGKSWQATLDPKLPTIVISSVIAYGLAALLANEWLYLLSCALLFAGILGFWLPFIMLASISVKCSLPENGIAYDDANVSVMIKHRDWLGPLKHLMPLNAMRARIILARRTISGFKANTDLSEQSILLDSAGKVTLLAIAVPHLSRGVFKMSHATICSAFPFGLVWWIRKITPQQSADHPDSIIVYPRLCSMRGNFLLQIKGMLSTMGMAFSETLALTQSTSVRGLREFRVGDSLRHIHWASSARTSKLLVREFDSETLPIFDLFFDLTAKWDSREQFELAVCIAHSLIQFGYDRDMLPELFLRPRLDSDQLSFCMDDLPLAQPPLEMLSEILARVEPIPTGVPAAQVDSRRQVLALAPSGDRVLRGTVGHGQLVSPVQLLAVSRDDCGQIPTGKLSGEVIATIYSEEDLEAL